MKILVIRYRFLGDTILTVPFLQKLKEAHPEAKISVLIGPQSGELLKNCPYIDELIVFDTTRFHRYDSGENKKQSFFKYAWELRKQKFDKVYILKRSFSSAVLAWLAGIKERIGFNTEGRGFLLTQKIPFNPNQHEVLNFLAHLPAPFCEPPPKDSALFWPSPQEKNKAQSLMDNLKPNQKKVLIHAPAAHPVKMWPSQYWANLLQKLKAQNYQIIFSGAPTDAEYYAEIEKQAEIQADLNLCKTNTSLRENIAVYALCDLAICVDSGPMHLAAAVNLPIIALFGPSNANRWQPWSNKFKVLTAPIELKCRPCNAKPICANYECLSELKPEEVFKAAEEFLL
jgi:heptosyltransferase-2